MNRKWSGVAFYLVLLGMLIFGIYFMNPSQRSTEEISYTKLVEMVQKNQVKSIDLKGSEALVTKKNKDVVRTNIPPVIGDSFYEQYLKGPVEKGEIALSSTPANPQGPTIASFLPTFLVMLFMGYLFFSFMRSQQGAGGRMMNFGKSKARVMDDEETKRSLLKTWRA